MTLAHHIVGGILILAYLIVFILTFFNESLSRRFRIVADTLLFLQYVIGIILLISGSRNINWHYVFALLPIVLIPFSRKLGPRITSLLFLIFVFLAYWTGFKRAL